MTDSRIGLKDAIQAAYEELLEAMTTIPVHSELNFEYRTIDLEFTVEATHEETGKSGVRFWVIEAGVDASRQRTRTHVVKLSIVPVGRSGAPVQIHARRPGKG